MSTPEQPRIWQSHVWHQGTCFYVSTIERAFETAEGKMTCPETLVWEYDWEKQERGKLLHQAGGVTDHQQICRCLIAEGQFPDENNPATARFCETELQRTRDQLAKTEMLRAEAAAWARESQTKLEQAQAALAALHCERREDQELHAQEMGSLYTENSELRDALAAVTLERDEAKSVAIEERRTATSLVSSLNSLGEENLLLKSQLAACQSREAKALEELKEYGSILVEVSPGEHGEGVEMAAASAKYIKATIDYLQKEWDNAERRAADRDQFQAQVGALRGALTGLLDSPSALTSINEAILADEHARRCKAREALRNAPAAPDSAKDGADTKRLDWLENGPCTRIEALPIHGAGPLYRWHLFDSRRKDPSQSLNSVRAAIDAAMSSAKEGAL